MNLRSAPGLTYYFWVGIALILIFSILEPVGTQDAGLIKGFIIWTIQISLLLPILIGLHISLQAISVFNNLNPWIKLTLSGLSGALVFIPLGLIIDHLFQLDDWSAVRSSDEMIAMVVEESGGIILSVALTWIAINAPRILQINFKETSFADTTKETLKKVNTRVSITGFISQIPKELGTDIIYLKSELHYVRVVTTVGENLILFNMKDAIADLEKDYEGIQTHRSYWVSNRYIKSLITDKSRKYIITTKEQRIPVSRRKLSHVKEFMRRRL
jgi:hypothetical protein